MDQLRQDMLNALDDEAPYMRIYQMLLGRAKDDLETASGTIAVETTVTMLEEDFKASGRPVLELLHSLVNKFDLVQNLQQQWRTARILCVSRAISPDLPRSTHMGLTRRDNRPHEGEGGWGLI